MSKLTREELIQSVIEGLSFPDSDDFTRSIEDLRGIQESQIRDIFEDLLDDPDSGLALGIASAIGILECNEAIDFLIVLVEEPGKWFGHSERASISLAAVESLGILRDERGVNVLLELIGYSREEHIQMEAIRSLGMIGSPLSVRPLAEAMIANPPIALSAAGAIAEIGGEMAFKALVESLLSDEEVIKSASIWALGKMGDERAINPLIKLTNPSDSFMRRDIAWALGQIGGLRARLMLGAMCQGDPDFAVRREAARTIKAGAVLGKNRAIQE